MDSLNLVIRNHGYNLLPTVLGGECGGGFCVFKFVFVETPLLSLLDCRLPCCLPSSSDPDESEAAKVAGGPARAERVLFSPVFLLILDILLDGFIS